MKSLIDRDWVGNNKSTYTTLGASNHTDHDRAGYDYYATDPIAIDLLLDTGIELSNSLWECACGEGHLSKRLELRGFNVKSTDIVDRGYGEVSNFLTDNTKFIGDIITNPPYKYALEFIEHGLYLVPVGFRVVMFLKLTFLEGQKRRRLFDTHQLRYVYVFSKRIECGPNGKFSGSSAVAYAWYIFEKGYNGPTEVRWI